MPSPLAEGRELKFHGLPLFVLVIQSPLAEGRELKYKWEEQERPTQGDVAPRGGA